VMKSNLCIRTAAIAGAMMAAVFLGGCNLNIELPPVELSFPIATNATVPVVTNKDGDKLQFGLPELCDLPDLAELEEEVRDALGRAGGLLDIKSVTLDEITITATQGNFDFLDQVALIFTKNGESIQLGADLRGLSNVTSFSALPDAGRELNILGLLPRQGECLEGDVIYNGGVPSGTTVYNATMHVTIRSTLHL
jgi:hypothetical protein